jgi:hypothetical protein
VGDRRERGSSEDLIRQARERIESRPSSPESTDTPESPAAEESQEERLAAYVRQEEERERIQPRDSDSAIGSPQLPDNRSVRTPPDLTRLDSQVPWYQQRWLRVVGGVAIGIAFAAFSGEGGPDRDDSGAIAEVGTINVIDVRVGDCLNDQAPEGDETYEVFEFEAVPCGDAHDIEVYSLSTHGGSDTYPGDDAFHEWGSQRCYDAFEAYVGAPWEASLDLDYLVYWPTEEAWDDGDRDVICAAYPTGEDSLRGSVAGQGPSADKISLGTVLWADLAVGDCLAVQTENDPIDRVEGLSCEGMHDFEVYSVSRYPHAPDAAFPGEDTLFAEGDEFCFSEFDAFVGNPTTGDAQLTYYVVWPWPDEWADGDRSLICLAATISGKQLLGSLASEA